MCHIDYPVKVTGAEKETGEMQPNMMRHWEIGDVVHVATGGTRWTIVKLMEATERAVTVGPKGMAGPCGIAWLVSAGGKRAVARVDALRGAK